MSSEHERQQSRLRGEQIEQSSKEPWADLELTIPNDRSQISIASFVECVLVELTYEEVGAEYVSANVWGAKRTQFIATDDVVRSLGNGTTTSDSDGTNRRSVGGLFARISSPDSPGRRYRQLITVTTCRSTTQICSASNPLESSGCVDLRELTNNTLSPGLLLVNIVLLSKPAAGTQYATRLRKLFPEVRIIFFALQS